MSLQHKADGYLMAQPSSTELAKISGSKRPSFQLRRFRPGDLGYIIHRHGAFYEEQYQWGTEFEAVVARIVVDFFECYDSRKENCWIAENLSDGVFLGSIMLVKDRGSTDPSTIAKLRLLYVEPDARGMGIGEALIRQCTHFARAKGYSKIGLWTQSILVAARRLYAREGYKLIRSEEHKSFGILMMGEHWELTL